MLYLYLPLLCLIQSIPKLNALPNALPKNDRPIIGILSVPLAVGGCVTEIQKDDGVTDDATSCFQSIYVKWLESSGARVVPIRYDSSDTELLRLANSLNGILFTGGDTPIIHTDSQYMHAAGLLLNHTISAKDYFPLWGTCMGIQTLSILVAGTADILESGIFTGVDPQMMSLNLTSLAASSKLLGTTTTPPSILQSLQSSDVTTNLHHDGINPQTYVSNQRLHNFFDLLSTNMDTSSHSFISTIEAKSHPIYAAQWHPERPQFDWTFYNGKLNHDLETIQTMQYFSNFFVNEARKNNRSFASEKEELSALIYNYSPQVSDRSYQAYLFGKDK